MDMMNYLLVFRVNYEKTVILITIQSSFLSNCKNIALYFALIKTGFLSGYENIVLIFGLIKTAFLSSFKNVVLIFLYIKWVIVKIILRKI